MVQWGIHSLFSLIITMSSFLLTVCVSLRQATACLLTHNQQSLFKIGTSYIQDLRPLRSYKGISEIFKKALFKAKHLELSGNRQFIGA